MIRIVTLISFSFLFFGFECHSQTIDTLSLADCISLARKNNLQVKGAFLQKQKSDQGVSIAKNNYLPSIQGAARNSYNWGLFIDPSTNILTTRNNELYSAGVEGELELFNGGFNYYFLKEQEELYASNTALLEAARNDAAIAVTMAYYAALFATEQIELAENQILQAENQNVRVKGMVDGGALPYREYLMTSSELALREAEKETAKSTYLKSLLLLKQLMGLDEAVEIAVQPQKISVPDRIMVPDYDSISSYVTSVLPEFEAAKKRLSASRYRYKQVQALRYPTFALTGGVITRSSSLQQLEQSVQFRRNLSEYVAFRMTVPIFNKFNNINRLQLTRLDAEINEVQVLQIEDEVQQRVQEVWLDLQASHKRLLAMDQRVKALEQEYVYGERAFYTGLINYSEFNYIYNLYNAAQIQMLQAQYQFMLNQHMMSYYNSGQFTVED